MKQDLYIVNIVHGFLSGFTYICHLSGVPVDCTGKPRNATAYTIVQTIRASFEDPADRIEVYVNEALGTAKKINSEEELGEVLLEYAL